MQVHQATTPFGRRPLSLATVAAQAKAAACPKGKVVHKWRVFHAICEARAALGVSERSLAVLDALLSFHPETVLEEGTPLVVFPSNVQLSLRAHGMASSTLRRQLATLVEAGLVIRRDSANGKRYARKGQGGAVEQAFGFDLSALVARSDEFETAADAVRTARAELRRLRERVTIVRRDVVKMIAAGREQGAAADWAVMERSYRAIVSALPRGAGAGELVKIAEELDALASVALKSLEAFTYSSNTNTRASQDERHKQNSNTNHPNEPEESLARKEPDERKEPMQASSMAGRPVMPLSLVLEACPTIASYARNEIRSWRDFLAAAELVRSLLGISPSAYEGARAAMGEGNAACAVAAILERADAIKSPGGYIRDLTGKAEEGRFSVAPMIMALLNVSMTASRRHASS